MSKSLPFDDISMGIREGDIFVYHVQGLSAHMGTCKLHSRPDCPALIAWIPEGTKSNWVGRFGKVLIKNNYSPDSIGESQKCKRCWKRNG